MTYSYTPLSNSYIRLLVLEPYDHHSSPGPHLESRIRGRLISVKFSTVGYQALSYCWGDDGSKKEILIGDRVMQVGENLWLALYHLSRSSFVYGAEGTKHWLSRCLWIDAICINQHDLQERNLEVSRMSEVYRKAQRVIIWLGPANSNSVLAMAVLNSIDRNGIPDNPRPHFAAFQNIRSPLGYDPRVREALMDFFNRPYFSRMWIVQEIILANEIIIFWGPTSLLWSKLSNLFNCINDPVLHRDLQQATAIEINNSLAKDLHQNRKKWQERKTNLEELLVSYSRNKCRDPRDKVYSLLGIAADCQNGELEADYNKDLGTVYQDVIRLWTDHKRPGDDISGRIVHLSELLHLIFGPELEMQSKGWREGQLVPVAGSWRGTISTLGPQFGETDVDGIMPTSLLLDGEPLLRFDFSSSSFLGPARTVKILDDFWFLLRRPAQREEYASFAIVNYRKPAEHTGLGRSLSNASRRWKSKVTRPFAPSATTQSPRSPFYFFELSTGYLGISFVPAQHDDIICTFGRTSAAVLLRKSMAANRYDVIAKVILFDRPVTQSSQLSESRRDWLDTILKLSLYKSGWETGIWNRKAEVELWLEMATLRRFTSYPY